MEPVLTIRQPWASAIFCAGKDVENRPRRTHYRGPLWIHAGTFKARNQADGWANRHGLWLPEEPLPRGVILGRVELIDCREDCDSRWALPGQYHWLLGAPQLLVRPVPHKGSLTFSWRRPPQGKLRRTQSHRTSHR